MGIFDFFKPQFDENNIDAIHDIIDRIIENFDDNKDKYISYREICNELNAKSTLGIKRVRDSVAGRIVLFQHRHPDVKIKHDILPHVMLSQKSAMKDSNMI